MVGERVGDSSVVREVSQQQQGSISVHRVVVDHKNIHTIRNATTRLTSASAVVKSDMFGPNGGNK